MTLDITIHNYQIVSERTIELKAPEEEWWVSYKHIIANHKDRVANSVAIGKVASGKKWHTTIASSKW